MYTIYRKSQYNKCGYSPQSHVYIQCNTGNNKGSTYDSQQDFYKIWAVCSKIHTEVGGGWELSWYFLKNNKGRGLTSLDLVALL